LFTIFKIDKSIYASNLLRSDFKSSDLDKYLEILSGESIGAELNKILIPRPMTKFSHCYG